MARRIKTKYPGVYQRESEKPLNGKPNFCFDITYKIDNRKIWEKVGWLSEGYSEKLAADIRAERLRSIRHGDELPKQKAKVPRLDEVWLKYKDWALVNKRARDDISRYNNHIKLQFGNKRLNEISSFHLERLKSDLLKKDLAPATVKHILVIIRQIYNKAIAWGLYKGENPIKNVKMPIVVNRRTRFLSYEEARELLETLKAKDMLIHDMALLSLHCGLRAGEIFNLKSHDLDFDNNVLRVSEPKNKTIRFAYMTDTVKSMLQRRMPAHPGDLIFQNFHGGKFQQVSREFREIVNDLGFNKEVKDRKESVSFHTLRHTFASWLAIQGESLFTLKELLGHKSTQMTERYAHLIPNNKRIAVKNLEKMFNDSNITEVENEKN
jgi:integrase